jgi:UDP-2-acetamido-2-deoxy-ribo-hexuluronate aminotransferase
MRPIQMVDLKQQYAKIKTEVDTALHEVLDSSAFIQGKQVTEFAEHLAGTLI